MATAMSFNCPNYSGALFLKGNKNTPFTTMIGNNWVYSDSVEFSLGQHYTVGGGTQPAISEEASLTAPTATVTTRTQETNVCQIFHEKISVSDAKASNMGTLHGLNVAGQQANPLNEMDFQAMATMQKIAKDIEYTALNGAYNKATTDAQINKSRGIITATTTNVVDADGAEAGYWLVRDALQKIYNQGGDTDGLMVLCNGVQMSQFMKEAKQNNVSTMAGTINGINVTGLVTDFGTVYLRAIPYVPNGTVEIANLSVCRPVGMIVPGKGNFYREALAKVGAADTEQIFGQFGLDYGKEFLHAKIVNCATTFTAPKNGILTYTIPDPTPEPTGDGGESQG